MSLLDKIPEFARVNRMVRANILSNSDNEKEFLKELKEQKPIDVTNVKDANLITSEVGEGLHRPILDIDFDAELVSSSTPGHWHLYLDKLVKWEDYLAFLEAAAKIGIIQQGILKGAKERGFTSVRMPHVKKNDIAANVIDYEDFLAKEQASKSRAILEAFIQSSGFSKESLDELLNKLESGQKVDVSKIKAGYVAAYIGKEKGDPGWKPVGVINEPIKFEVLLEPDVDEEKYPW